jgi:hypothetical protein
MEFFCISVYKKPSAPTDLGELSDDSGRSEEVKVNRIDNLDFKRSLT